MLKDFQISVFTKPWKEATPEYLGSILSPLGVTAVELAVRDESYINQKNCHIELPRAVSALEKYGIHINSIGPDVFRYVNQDLVKICGDNGIPFIRIMQFINIKKGYHQSLKEITSYYIKLAEILIRHNVKIAFQNHGNGYWISSPSAVDDFVKSLPKEAFCEVFEPGHCIMAEPLDMGLDIMKERMAWISLKTGFYRNLSRPTADESRWEHVWTTHEHGRFSWGELINLIHYIGYKGIINFSGQYSHPSGPQKFIEGDSVLPFLKKDILFFKKTVNRLTNKNQ